MASEVIQHALRPLLAPQSVAIVGASERPGSLGRIVFENALRGAFDGEIYAVNPRHRSVLGRRTYRDLEAVGSRVDLAIVCAPANAVWKILDGNGKRAAEVAVLLTEPPRGEVGAARRWVREVAQVAARRGTRVIGPGAFGVIRPGIGLNASVADLRVAAGRLALVAQSGAVCMAMLDFAAPLGIGFSMVASLGDGIDVNFGEMLDLLVLDDATEGILLYVESVRDARRFVSALRAAARTKPVVVLKAGRSSEPPRRGNAPSADAVFEAALRRAGTVRVRSYTQLFAAARILAMGRIPRGDRAAIVANGRGPALLAADSALERKVRLATLSSATASALEALMPEEPVQGNPVDVRGDAPPERFAGAVAALLADPGVDAVVALHVPRQTIPAIDVARAVAAVTRGADKPVLAAWLGAIERPEVREALEAGGIANFYTPENAIEAFSFLAAYRRHQEWLLEVPSPQPDPEPPDIAAAHALRVEAEAEGRTALTEAQAQRLLAAFKLDAPAALPAHDAGEAKQAARTLGYPVALTLDASASKSSRVLRRDGLRDARSVARAYGELIEVFGARPRRSAPALVTVRKALRGAQPPLSIGVYTDRTFGPVIAFGPSLAAGFAWRERVLMLPPLNRRLARDLVVPAAAADDAVIEGLVRLLVNVSALVCALPWVVELELDPIEPAQDRPLVTAARIVVDHRRARLSNYAHLAIHPYPTELVSGFRARNGAAVTIRPIRPEDASLELRFVNSLSDRTRYLRFFYRMHELTPVMLARFTQVDYDRELALVAVVEDRKAPEGASFAGVARFIELPDRAGAEYAIVVHDDWQRQAIGGALMQRLIEAARRKGLARLEGTVLRENATMLAFVTRLGFEVRDDPGDAEQLLTSLDLRSAR